MFNAMKSIFVIGLLLGTLFLGYRILQNTSFQGEEVKAVAASLKENVQKFTADEILCGPDIDAPTDLKSTSHVIPHPKTGRSASVTESHLNNSNPTSTVLVDQVDREMTKEVLKEPKGGLADREETAPPPAKRSVIAQKGLDHDEPQEGKVQEAPDPKRMADIRKLYADTINELSLQ